MVRRCSNCGETIEDNSNFCISCGVKIEEKNKFSNKYDKISTTSFLISCLELGFFWWFISAFDAIFNGVVIPAEVTHILFFTFNGLILITLFVGVILGLLSIKKGLKFRAIFGSSVNFLAIGLHIYLMVVFTRLILNYYQ